MKRTWVIWIASGRITTKNALRSVGRVFLTRKPFKTGGACQDRKVLPDWILTSFESHLSDCFGNFLTVYTCNWISTLNFFRPNIVAGFPLHSAAVFSPTLQNLLLAKKQQCENHGSFCCVRENKFRQIARAHKLHKQKLTRVLLFVPKNL